MPDANTTITNALAAGSNLYGGTNPLGNLTWDSLFRTYAGATTPGVIPLATGGTPATPNNGNLDQLLTIAQNTPGAQQLWGDRPDPATWPVVSDEGGNLPSLGNGPAPDTSTDTRSWMLGYLQRLLGRNANQVEGAVNPLGSNWAKAYGKSTTPWQKTPSLNADQVNALADSLSQNYYKPTAGGVITNAQGGGGLGGGWNQSTTPHGQALQDMDAYRRSIIDRMLGGDGTGGPGGNGVPPVPGGQDDFGPTLPGEGTGTAPEGLAGSVSNWLKDVPNSTSEANYPTDLDSIVQMLDDNESYNPWGAAVNYNADQIRSLLQAGVPLSLGYSKWVVPDGQGGYRWIRADLFNDNGGNSTAGLWGSLSPEARMAMAQAINAIAPTYHTLAYVNGGGSTYNGGANTTTAQSVPAGSAQVAGPTAETAAQTALPGSSTPVNYVDTRFQARPLGGATTTTTSSAAPVLAGGNYADTYTYNGGGGVLSPADQLLLGALDPNFIARYT